MGFFGGGGGGGASGLSLTEPPSSGWSWMNQGSSSVAQADGKRTLTIADSGQTANLVGEYRAHSSGDIHTGLLVFPSGIAGSFAGAGLGFRSATGQLDIGYMIPGQNDFNHEAWASPTSYSSGNSLVMNGLAFGMWLQVEDDGTDLFWRCSPTGEAGTWEQIYTVGRTVNLTGGPTGIVVVCRDYSEAQTIDLRSFVTT